MIPNKNYIVWEKDAVEQLKLQKDLFEHETITEPVAVQSFIYRLTLRRIDMINALQSVHDALENAEIIKNDFQIKSTDGSRLILGVSPGKNCAEIYIEEFKHFWEGVKNRPGLREVSTSPRPDLETKE